MDTILLTNGQLRKTLSAARSLGKKGIKVIVAEQTIFNPSGFSKYCSKNIAYPSPVKRKEDFLNWLDLVIKKHNINLMFPMDDDTMEVMIRERTNFENKLLMPLPPSQAYNKATDKWTSQLMAKNAGLSSPDSVLPDGPENLLSSIKGMQFPMMVKARMSSGSRGLRVVKDIDELKAAYDEVHSLYPFPMIQERIPTGPRYDVCLLFDKQSNLAASFAQSELRHFPVEMGPSTAQRSEKIPELVEQVTGMMKNESWIGIAEAEFMYDVRDEKYKFMEINTRFWNSLELAVYCGTDFPYYLYKILKGEEVPNIPDYPPGKYCRCLLPGDILHFLSNSNRFKLDPPFLGGAKVKMHDDIIALNDPLPTLGFISACGRYFFDPKIWRFLFKR